MFTLLELLLVISIIAILLGLMQPLFFKAKEHAKYAKWLVYTKNLRSDPSLVGQWTFDTDELGLNSAQGFSVDFYNSKEYNAEIFGTASAKNGRWHKESIYLAGNQNSYLKIDDGALYNPGKEDMTIIIWFKPTTKNTRFIICKGDGQNRRHAGWAFYQNRIFHIRTCTLDNQKFRNRKKDVLELNRWHFAALVVDNSNKRVQMYLDNKMIYSKEIKANNNNKKQTADFTASENYTVIGRRARRGGYFRGYIDEVEIFKRALTPSEIKQFYDVGSKF